MLRIRWSTIRCLCNVAPSTSRQAIGQEIETATLSDERNKEKLRKEAEERRKEQIEVLNATRTRIKRWRNRTHALLPETADRVPSLSDAEWAEKMLDEEREWDERVQEMAQSLEESVVPSRKQQSTESSMDGGSREKSTAVKLRAKGEISKPDNRDATRFRRILYTEGELDKSDLSQPPSITNPHPFDPMVHAPPISARSLVPFVNHSGLLQVLVELGVNLFEVDTNTRLGKHLLKLDPIKDVQPKVKWLVSLGVSDKALGDYLTRNPFFLIQNLDDMKARVNYLSSKRFNDKQILKIVTEFRYWLNVDVKTMDSRLGWIQVYGGDCSETVRPIRERGSRGGCERAANCDVWCWSTAEMFFQRLVNMLNKECKFLPAQVKQMLIDDPRLYIMDAKYVAGNYWFVRKVMGLSNEVVGRNPFILRCSLSSLRSRHEFLKRIGKANYEGMEEPERTREESEKQEGAAVEDEKKVMRIEDILLPSDVAFSKAAGTYVVVYERFLRNS